MGPFKGQQASASNPVIVIIRDEFTSLRDRHSNRWESSNS